MFAGIKLIVMSTMSIDIVTLTYFLTGRKPRKSIYFEGPWPVEDGCPKSPTSSRNV
jgi:hypothetical protein